MYEIERLRSKVTTITAACELSELFDPIHPRDDHEVSES